MSNQTNSNSSATAAIVSPNTATTNNTTETPDPLEYHETIHENCRRTAKGTDCDRCGKQSNSFVRIEYGSGESINRTEYCSLSCGDAMRSSRRSAAHQQELTRIASTVYASHHRPWRLQSAYSQHTHAERVEVCQDFLVKYNQDMFAAWDAIVALHSETTARNEEVASLDEWQAALDKAHADNSGEATT